MATVEKRIEKMSERLRNLREEKGWSQQELGNRAGIDRKTVNRIENGHFSPSITTLFMLSDALKVDAADILG
jgi:putative transcriptional regulator